MICKFCGDELVLAKATITTNGAYYRAVKRSKPAPDLQPSECRTAKGTITQHWPRAKDLELDK